MSSVIKIIGVIDKWSILAALRFMLASIVAIKHMDDYTALGCFGIIAAFGTFEAILGFLLISGYSISSSYAKQPEGFIVRRIMRLYPIYLAAIAMSYLAYFILQQPMPPITIVAANLLFLNQLFTHTSLVGPAWSLSLEFWLYCLTPFLMLVSPPRLRPIIFGSFACYLTYTACRTLFHMPYYSGVGFGANLVLLSFIWVAGLRLAKSGGESWVALRDIGFLFAGHIAVTVAIQVGFRMKHHSLREFFVGDMPGLAMQSLTLLVVYLIFKYLVVPERPDVHRSWFFRLLGDISYPLYLLHAAVFAILSHFGLKAPALLYLSAVLVSAGVYWVFDFYSKRRHQQVGTN